MNVSGEKVLITGAGGVIGRALEKELRDAGYSNVVSITSKDLDLRDQVATEDAFKAMQPTLVFHLAARVYGIMGNMSNRGIAYLDNVRINTNVVDAARQTGCRKVVAMGSTAIYSDRVRLPMSEEEIWIGEPHYSEAPYAHSKRGMLAQLAAYKEQYDMDYAFCVSTNLFGPHDKFDEKFGHVIPSLVSKFYRAAELDQPMSVWGTGKAERDFLFSSDAAYALRLIAERHSGAINLATGESHTIRHTVDTLCEISGYRGTVEWDATKPDGQKLRAYDVSRLDALGFKPRVKFEDALAITYDWYRNNVASARK
ncbi:GDP-L-fucose synthase family protein [Paraburkholderia rhizosphaerae]|uniref:GDP-L-fucose synthase n=1 Tax=Paraburkholderia rhizosphaerae TaxID=480658 RepID=A0A4R8L591_9BURK|nr:GDP-L-fucose synthase [Paraburkholderia rhizosphaerae]TDY37149.1 GDP-L-fucose synthase [Paraburkholderia rhizosphaerae]